MLRLIGSPPFRRFHHLEGFRSVPFELHACANPLCAFCALAGITSVVCVGYLLQTERHQLLCSVSEAQEGENGSDEVRNVLE